VNPALRSSAAHVFVASLASPQPEDDDAHHLFRVLRLRDGEVVTVSDGQGAWCATRVVAGHLQQDTDIVQEAVPVALTIASAIPKGDRAEWMVQKLTEIGVTELALLHCARSVVRWEGERGARQRQRMKRVAREAAMQSRRVWLPTLSGPFDAQSVLQRPHTVLAEPAGVPRTELPFRPSTVVIGPEGGFSAEELAGDVPRVRLGATVLRVETAAVVAAVTFLI